jgi:D-psicose/D-tagatose/L-ribulose 3-epimerase
MSSEVSRRTFLQVSAAAAATSALVGQVQAAAGAPSAAKGPGMKTSMNVLLWTSHLTVEQFPLLQKIKTFGFEGVELPMFGGEEEHFAAVGKEVRRLGLGCSGVTVMTPEANPVDPDASVRKAAAERLRWAIRCTANAGGNMLCGPIHSALGVFTGVAPTAEERKRCADVIASVADYARQANVRLAVEYLCRFEAYVLTTAKDTVDMVKAINHPSVGMLYDTFHANIEEKDPVRALEEAMPHVTHVHISENDRGTPGRGHVRWEQTFAVLRRHNYNGWLAIEAFGRAMPEIAAATRVWRDFFASPDEVCIEGLAMMKRLSERA